MSIKNSKSFNLAGTTIKMSPGEMVRELRDLKGWSQLKLAEETGISQANISAIENERVEMGKQRAIALAEVFHVHPASILFADYESTA